MAKAPSPSSGSAASGSGTSNTATPQKIPWKQALIVALLVIGTLTLANKCGGGGKSDSWGDPYQQADKKRDGGGGFSVFTYNESPKPQPPTPKQTEETVVATKNGWSEPVDITYFEAENYYPNPVQILLDAGKETERLIEHTRQGMHLVKKDGTRQPIRSIRDTGVAYTEQFKSISDDSMKVTVKLTPKW